MILVDSSALVAASVEREPHHADVFDVLDREAGPFILSPVVLCELDYLLLTRHGQRVELAFLDQVAEDAYELPQFETADVRAARDVIVRYRDLGVGLADASIVVLASRYGTNRVLTLDERHFRALRTLNGEPFVVLPADA